MRTHARSATGILTIIIGFAFAFLAMAAGAMNFVSAEENRPVKSLNHFPSVDKLPAHPDLPGPLVMLDGTRVSSIEQWNTSRKPELKALFQHYMYGFLPTAPEKISAEVFREDKDFYAGKATLRQIRISLGPAGCPPINLLLFVPNRSATKASPPVILGLNFNGNHTVDLDKRIAIPTAWMPDDPSAGVANHRATEKGRGSQADRWQIEHAIDRGYAVATFYYGDIAPDKSGPLGGVMPYFIRKEKTTSTDDDCGAIAAWAWGLSRAVDYLLTDSDIDSHRIIVFGHSRNGKAAILAGAMDDRIAATIAHQAGCGGTSPSRRRNPKGESVKIINEHFPHWFDGAFKMFVGQEDKLPVDQNCLIALCCPRPVLLTCGEVDQWADPAGELENLRAADDVYRLFGVEGISKDAKPENNKRIGGHLAYYTREAPHTVDKVFWEAFLDFADTACPAK